MESVSAKDNSASEELDSLMEKLSTSAIEFRRTTSNIIFERLRRLFQSMNKEISKDSKLKEIFPDNFTQADWDELQRIGLKIPGLRRTKVFDYLAVTYLIVALGSLLVFSILNLDLIFAVWGLPIFGFTIVLAGSPILLLTLVFKRRYFPSETIDKLVDQIVSVNWTDLLNDDKRMFKEIVRQENEFANRASAQE